MADGLITAHANAWLNMIKATAYTAPVGSYVKLHTANPGAAAATAASAVTTRQSITWTTSTVGQLVMTSAPTPWNMTTGETITDISLWSDIAAGNALWTVQLATPKTVASGDTLTLSTFTLGLTPIAA
jgi:prophage tail gpP-like protein